MTSTLHFKASPPDGFIANSFVPFLNANVKFTIWPQTDPARPGMDLDAPTLRQLDLANSILEWPTQMRVVIDDAAERYRAATDESIGLAEYQLGYINRQNIREHYQVYGIGIPSFEEIEEPVDYIWLLCGCAWEEEHGMECIFRGQDLIYCDQSDCLYQAPHFRNWTHVNWV